MAQKVNKTTKSTTKNAKQATVPASDLRLRSIGLVLIALGVFAVVSVISHFFNWASDLSALNNDPEFSGVKIPFENACKGAGARIAYWVVDMSFGVFGLIIPIVLMVIGWRVFRRQLLNINHFALSAALLLIMGSLTLGVVDCKTDWSYDLGGAIGVACASDLLQAIGAGMILVLFVGWILTGVFINHNFIRTVSNVSDKMVDKSGKILEGVKDFVVARKADDIEEEAADDAPAESPAMPATPELVAEEPRVQEYVIPRPEPQYEIPPVAPSVPQSEERPMTMNEYLAAKRAAELGEPEDDGFVVIPKNKPEEQPVQPAQPVLERHDDDFTVIANPTVKPNPINVDVLLKKEEDDDGFVVIRPEGNVEPEAPAMQEEPVVAPVVEDEDDGFVVISKEPKKSAAVVDDSDRIVVKVHENKVRLLDEDEIVSELYDPLRDLEHYKKPYVSLLEDYKSPHKVSDTEIYDNKCRIQETLKYFGIPIVDIDATVGPTVTLYEIKQAQGVKISKIQSLEKDIAQSLRAQGIRIIAPIPGKGTIGIEVPNRDKQIVSMYSSICSEEFQHAKMELPIVIGRTIQNENFTFDLAKLPHLLVAGATGQGKSVGLNAIITSLLYTKHPAQLKFVMIDPKMVEFSVYNKLERHFLAKMESEEESIITEPKKAVCVLNSLVEEMGRRLELLKMATSRNIVEYNEKFTARRLNPQKGHRFLPYIVVIIDEFADLIMTAKEVEVPVMRLAQKARAVGIHLIIATQRPDVKVITGGIKANFPARIAFRVMQMIDSRTIIDQPGANQLIGRGDMLFSNGGELTRIQCALVETKEVERLVDFIAKQQGYTEAYPLPDFDMDAGVDGNSSSDGESGAPVKYDALFGEVARAAVTNGMISTSSIQRNYEVGFNRAGRIMLQLERAGIVGPQVGAKPREIKFYDLPSLEAKLQSLGVF
ncbi:MAG: DNA translocase FtsK [Alistipes sp.]|nr:DNA translocase FtsK [Alistipes sp.]